MKTLALAIGLVVLSAVTCFAQADAAASRLKDIASVQGASPTPVLGYVRRSEPIGTTRS